MGWQTILQEIIVSGQNLVVTVLLLAMAGIIILFLVKYGSYKHPAILREIINNKKTIAHQTKWKFAKDKDGVEGIMFQKPKLFAPISDLHHLAFDITPNGKKFIEAELHPNGELEFVTYEAKSHQFQPLTTKQRSILVNQTINAQRRKKKNLFDTIEKVAPILSMTIIVIALMMFYADMAAPLLQMGDKMIEAKKVDLEILEELNALKNDIQIIKAEVRPDIIQTNSTGQMVAPN